MTLPPNGPELSCGNEVPERRNPVRAWYVQSNSSWLFRACKIVDGWFRQLERLVSPLAGFVIVPMKRLICPTIEYSLELLLEKD